MSNWLIWDTWRLEYESFKYSGWNAKQKKKIDTIIFEYKQALKSKIWKPVDDEIWTLEIMKEYWLSYKTITEETPFDIYELMKQKLIVERNQAKKKK